MAKLGTIAFEKTANLFVAKKLAYRVTQDTVTQEGENGISQKPLQLEKKLHLPGVLAAREKKKLHLPEVLQLGFPM